MEIRQIPTPGWEDVRYCEDAESGLRAFIAVHDTTLGPALGGCRRWTYQKNDDALEDVKRLSRGMTYKNSLAQLDLGGGKSVILASPGETKTPKLFQAFGRFIDALAGSYITAEDVGVSSADISEVLKETRHAVGSDEGPAAAGNPSPFTALGVFHGLRAAAKHRFGTDTVEGLTVAVQGLGQVGYRLCELLHESGAKLIVADINEAATRRASEALNAEVTTPDEVLLSKSDIIAPCALGHAITPHVAGAMHAGAIAGAANNQLSEPQLDAVLKSQGVVYAPDYAINAGGVINIIGEHNGAYDRAWVEARCRGLYDILDQILSRAAAENAPTGAVADRIAMERIAQARSEGRRFQAA